MLDFEVQRFTRQCAKSQRELQPGETFYSVLIAQGAEVVRRDFAQEAWEGPPDEALAWWKSSVPDPKARKMHWAPSDVMLHYFQQLEDQVAQQDSRYVLTLLMIRRRIFRLEETETEASGDEYLVVFCPRDENEYRVRVVTPTAERIEQIQQELARLLMDTAK